MPLAPSRLVLSPQHEVIPTSPTTSPPYAMVFDEATTNLVVNPSFETNVTDGWSGSNATLTQESTTVKIGTKSCKVEVTVAGTNRGALSATMAVSANTKYHFSVWVYGNAGAEDMRLRMIGDNSGATNVGFTAQQGWYRYFGTKTTNGSDTTLQVAVVTASSITATFFIDGAQLEANTGTVPTSYCDGTLGLGYSWSGTAHNSTSSRTSGMQWLAPYTAGSTNPFVIKPDGSLGAWKYLFKSEGDGTVKSDFPFDFQGSQVTATQVVGDVDGVMRVSNATDGNVLWVDASNVIDLGIGLVIDAGNLGGATAFAIGSPSDPTNFTGKYFGFFSKSGKQDWSWTKNSQKAGANNVNLQKYIEGYGGGKFASTTTVKAGSIITTGTAVFGGGTSFSTDFDLEDLIVANGQTRRIAKILSATTLNTTASFTAIGGTGAAYARVDNQYLPFAVYFEGPNGDHVSKQRTDLAYAFWFAGEGRPRFAVSSTDNTTTTPSGDTTGRAFVVEGTKTATTVNVTSAGYTTFFTYAFSAGELGSAGAVRITFYGTISNGANRTLQFVSLLGASTINQTIAQTMSGHASLYHYRAFFDLMNNAVPASQDSHFMLSAKVNADTKVDELLQNFSTSTVQTASQQTLTLKAKWGATGSTFTKEGCVMEIL